MISGPVIPSSGSIHSDQNMDVESSLEHLRTEDMKLILNKVLKGNISTGAQDLFSNWLRREILSAARNLQNETHGPCKYPMP